jgi:WD40 repeat protein
MALESTVTLWDTQSGKSLRQLPKLDTLISTLTFSANGQLLAGSGGPPAASLFSKSKETAPVADQNDTVATDDADPAGTIHVWTASTGTPLLSMRGHNETGLALAFSPDGSTLASLAYDKAKDAAGINLWNAASGQWLRSLSAEGPLYSVAFAPEGKTLLSSGGVHIGKVQVWDLTEARLKRILTLE